MSNTFTLHHFLGQENAHKCLIAARFANVTVNSNIVDLSNLKKGQLTPFLEFPDGRTLSQSNAIVRLFGRNCSVSGLYGRDFYEQALVDQWLEFLKNEIENPCSVVIYQILGHLPNDPRSYHQSGGVLMTKLKQVDAQLQGKNFLVGDQVTLADISMVSTLLNFYRFYAHQGKQKQLPNLTRIFTSLCALEQFSSVLGRVMLCQQEVSPGGGKKGGNKGGKGKGGNKGGKKQKQKQKQQQKKKKKRAPRKKHWTLMLPECKFSKDDFIEFKVDITNNDSGPALENFLAKVDHEGWSFWWMQYDKMEDECTDVLSTENCVSMFYQKCTRFLKYCYGVMAAVGDEPDLWVEGVFVWRGHEEAPAELAAHPSSEFYKRRRLDLKKPEDLQLVKEFWLNKEHDEDKMNGKTMRYYEVFK